MTPAARSGAWLALASGLVAAACPDPMRDQPKYEAWEENVYFDDRRAMRPLPVGTVPREQALLPAEAASGSGPDGGPIAEVPVPLARADLERGRHQFEIFCAACHGLLGDGHSVVASKMALRPPPSLLALRDRPAGHFYTVATRGFGMMPSYAAKLSPLDRWRVVAYVQALQASQHVPLEETPPGVQDQLRRQPP